MEEKVKFLILFLEQNFRSSEVSLMSTREPYNLGE